MIVKEQKHKMSLEDFYDLKEECYRCLKKGEVKTIPDNIPIWGGHKLCPECYKVIINVKWV